MTSAPAAEPDRRTVPADWDDWRAARHERVAGEHGDLALVLTEWLPDGAAPDLDEVSAAQRDDVLVTAVERRSLDTGDAEHGYRLWDPQSPARRSYVETSLFPYDPSWRVTATFTEVAPDRTVPYEHLRDAGATRELVVPGDLTATIAGRDYTLHAFDDGGTLLLVFADPTNGSPDETERTYGAGRFLFVDRPADGADVVLDFNRAFVPPCGYSDQYNCPLPPASNRLHVPVHAGERLVVHAPTA